MRVDHWLLIALWVVGIVGFIQFIVRTDLRKGLLSFMMFQAIIWFCNMFLFQYGFIRAPIRELPTAHDFPLTIDYFFQPFLFALFYLYRGRMRSKLTFFFIWISGVTLFDVIIERYTELLEFEKMTWYGLWVYMGLLYFISFVANVRA